MDHEQTVWLVCNAASGSNDEQSVAKLEEAFAEAGLPVARRIAFPDEPAPDPATLDAAGVDLVAVYAGDGTVHAVVTGLYGWGGAVLVLPGGTMNLLAKRLHGEAEAAEVVARLAGHPGRRVRPGVVHGAHGDGLSGMLAGPGAAWADVREAMREADIAQFIASARDAIAKSTDGPGVRCTGVDGGRAEGYAAVTVTPTDQGLHLRGYYAETLGDLAGQGIALIQRNFRNGPHDDLGCHMRAELASGDGAALDLLIDGESVKGTAREALELVPTQVDLVATLPEENPEPGHAR